MEVTDYILQSGYVLSYLLIFLIVFVESGVFFGFFLPGDSLLFSLGIAAAAGHLSLPYLIASALLGAILGVSAGYVFGKKVGPALFNRKDSWFFRRENVEKAQDFYEKHGKKTIILARFTPVVRTFAPILAGVANMEYRTFITYNIIGGLIWVLSMTLLGFFLGNVIPNIEVYALPLIVAIAAASFLPAILHLRKK